MDRAECASLLERYCYCYSFLIYQLQGLDLEANIWFFFSQLIEMIYRGWLYYNKTILIVTFFLVRIKMMPSHATKV